jgi:hypothetical protein
VCVTSCGWRLIFDVQSLQFGDHNVELTLLDATGDVALPSRRTTRWFDYAVVNETNAYPTLTNAIDTDPVDTGSVCRISSHAYSLMVIGVQ